jgi:hypothetical protein
MMPVIQTIVFWMEGVITPPLTDLLLAAAGLGKKKLTSEQWIQLRKIEKKTTIGDEPLSAYTESAARTLNCPILAKALLQQTTINEGILNLLQELSLSYHLLWASGLPEIWQQRVLKDWQAASGPIVAILPGRYSALSELVFHLEKNLILPRAHYLLIDNQAHRSMKAIRQELQINIFVDAQRLRRDLSLWGLIDR